VIHLIVLALLLPASFATSARAQNVTIPDPGLDAAVRAALQKPNGPLTAQDLLGLTNLTARSKNIQNLQGLEAAHHLRDLDLESNLLVNATSPAGFNDLNFLDLGFNPISSLALDADMT